MASSAVAAGCGRYVGQMWATNKRMQHAAFLAYESVQSTT